MDPEAGGSVEGVLAHPAPTAVQIDETRFSGAKLVLYDLNTFSGDILVFIVDHLVCDDLR